MKRMLDETKITSETVWRGSFLEVHRDRVRLPNGLDGTREFIKHPGASAIIPLMPDGGVLVVTQFRYPAGRTFIEFPAGKIDAGETAEHTAMRELVEETGWRAGQIAHLTTIHNALGYSDEHIELYVAKDLLQEAQQLDVEEFVEPEIVTLDWLLEEMFAGRITDVKTQCGIFWLERMVSGRLPWPTFKTI